MVAFSPSEVQAMKESISQRFTRERAETEGLALGVRARAGGRVDGDLRFGCGCGLCWGHRQCEGGLALSTSASAGLSFVGS